VRRGATKGVFGLHSSPFNTPILGNHCVQSNLYQLFIHLLAIIVWVYKFLTSKLHVCLVLGNFFERVIISQVVVIGVVVEVGLQSPYHPMKLCALQPGYVKSSHIYQNSMQLEIS